LLTRIASELPGYEVKFDLARLPEDRSADAKAAAWIARLQRPDRNAGLEHAFRKWLRSDPAHAASFEQACPLRLREADSWPCKRWGDNFLFASQVRFERG